MAKGVRGWKVMVTKRERRDGGRGGRKWTRLEEVEIEGGEK